MVFTSINDVNSVDLLVGCSLIVLELLISLKKTKNIIAGYGTASKQE